MIKILVLACLACATTRTPILRRTPSVSRSVTIPSERQIPEQLVRVPQTEAPCSQETLAGRFRVPKEPVGAEEIARRVALDSTFFWPEGLVGVGMEALNDRGGPQLVCLYWNLRGHDDKIDFYACRHLTENTSSYGYSAGKYPEGYAFDVFADANGEPAKFQHFMDQDHDGDICDDEFIHLEAEQARTR